MSAYVVSRTVEVNKKGSVDFDQWVATLLPKDARRAVAYFEKRNGPIAQAGLPLALSA